MKKILWILVNCPGTKEAERIGALALKHRLVACYDILPNRKSAYWWPPKTGRIERSRSCLLILETLPAMSSRVRRFVKQKHPDRLPMIGGLSLVVEDAFYRWVKTEVHFR